MNNDVTRLVPLFQIVQWESGVDKIIEVRDKPLMGICEWGKPVDLTDISSESSVRLFQGVHDIGEVNICRRRDRTRERSTERRKPSTERRKRSTERRKRSTERRKVSVERNVRVKGGKRKKVKRVNSKTKVTEDTTDKLRSLKAQNISDSKVRIPTAKEMKAIAGACQLSPTDSPGGSRFMIPEDPVKVKHSSGLKDFFLRKLRSQASKPRAQGKVLGKAIEDKVNSECTTEKDKISDASRGSKCTDNTHTDARKNVGINRHTDHLIHETAKHNILSRNLLNSILSDDENLTEKVREASKAKTSNINVKQNIDSADTMSLVSMGFATDCIVSFDKVFDPFGNTTLIEMNLKDYDLISSASDSLISPDKTTHKLLKTKSEDSLYGQTIVTRHTDINITEPKSERDTKLATDTCVGSLKTMNGDCNNTSDQFDCKDSVHLEPEHSVASRNVPVDEPTYQPGSMVNEIKSQTVLSKITEVSKHTDEPNLPEKGFFFETTKENTADNDKAENILGDSKLVNFSPVQTYYTKSESLREKSDEPFEIEGKITENDTYYLEEENDVLNMAEGTRSPSSEISAGPRTDEGHYHKDEPADEPKAAENLISEDERESPFTTDGHLIANDVKTYKAKSDKYITSEHKECNETDQSESRQKAPCVAVKPFHRVASSANKKEQYHATGYVASLSSEFSRKDNNLYNNHDHFRRDDIKVEHQNQVNTNKVVTKPDVQVKRTEHQIQIEVNEVAGKPDVPTKRVNHQNQVNIIEETCKPDVQEKRLNYQNQVNVNEEASKPDVLEKRLTHQKQFNTDDIASKPDDAQAKDKPSTINGAKKSFANNLKLQITGDRENKDSPSHENHLEEKECDSMTKPPTISRTDLYSCHSVAHKYVSVVNSPDLTPHTQTTSKPKGSIISKIKHFNSDNPKPGVTVTESVVSALNKNGFSDIANATNHNKDDVNYQMDYVERDTHELDKKCNNHLKFNFVDAKNATDHGEANINYQMEYVETDTHELDKKGNDRLKVSFTHIAQSNADIGPSQILIDNGPSQKKCDAESKLEDIHIPNKFKQLDSKSGSDTNDLLNLQEETKVAYMTTTNLDASVNGMKGTSKGEFEVPPLRNARKQNCSTLNDVKNLYSTDKSDMSCANKTGHDESDKTGLLLPTEIIPAVRNSPEKTRGHTTLSPNSKVAQWLKHRKQENEGVHECSTSNMVLKAILEKTGAYKQEEFSVSDEMDSDQSRTPKDVEEYLNDLHKDTPSFTKSGVALLEQNINCIEKCSSMQQTIDDRNSVSKRYSECNKTIGYTILSCSSSPKFEDKEPNVKTDVLGTQKNSLWDLVDKYKVPIGVSIAAACATVLICKKRL